ncbi:MAG: phosphatidylserine decarboxylase family protein [Pseudomonadota bacterium]
MQTTHAVYRRKPKQVYIAQEGYPFIAIALIGALVLWLVGVVLGAWIMLFITGFIAFFFRNPNRTPPEGKDLILAPADGKILSIEKNVKAPYTGNASTKVSIFMSVLNVHMNRFPITASVKDAFYNAGRFLVASLDKASEHNERHTLLLEDGAGREYVLVQIAGLIARRIVCYLKVGDTLLGGDRFGLIRFGSRVDIYLPPEAKVEVEVGKKTRGGVTVLGRFR